MNDDRHIERWTSETELLQDLRQRGFSPNRHSYPPGTLFPPHTHGEDKMATVISGRFRITMGGRSLILTALEGVFVPKGVVHRAEVVGDQVVVSVDAPRRPGAG